MVGYTAISSIRTKKITVKKEIITMKIVAVHKFNNKITEYKLENGKIIDTAECIQMVKDGKIEDCNVGVNRQGEEFVRSNRGTKSENTTSAENKIEKEKKEKKEKKEPQAVADSSTPKKRGRPRKVVEQPESSESTTPTSSTSAINLNDLPTF